MSTVTSIVNNRAMNTDLHGWLPMHNFLCESNRCLTSLRYYDIHDMKYMAQRKNSPCYSMGINSKECFTKHTLHENSMVVLKVLKIYFRKIKNTRLHETCKWSMETNPICDIPREMKSVCQSSALTKIPLQ